MKFDELDDRMRVFETAHDLCVLPGLFMVARLDGRSFTHLTKEVHQFEAPFDARFRDMILATADHLMTSCGFNVVYGYTQSDEISLLFALEENSFQRKLRKLHSILSGEASAKFSLLLLGTIAVFDYCIMVTSPRSTRHSSIRTAPCKSPASGHGTANSPALPRANKPAWPGARSRRAGCA
jgi:tRNA(His) guanylyltransferase